MTNEERASICPNCLTDITKSCHNGCVLFESYKVMEWKDQQFKEYLEKKKEREIVKREKFATSISEENYYDYRANLIGEIINELFGEIKKDNSDREE